MNNNELSTEQIILEAAEAEFLEKGYGNTKTVAIARRAGVSHSMLHYYFRTKEQLFQKIFKEKVQILAQMFGGIFEKDRPFTETVRLVVETQFNFVAQNPQLPPFIFNEILSNEENRKWSIEALFPQIFPHLCTIEKLLNDEIAKGAVRPITIRDLILNAISINVVTFLALPVLKDTFNLDGHEALTHFLNERRESNVQFILNALKP
ncbi:MAG: TetR/AcrR family transcriptional regulator [Dysgonamonadaceae bacterium]|jgi:AcrR family transcriptional regulator|nr:TetR/AcrR family transcriptional regulator [Dysgonamonadaceae bacterium]